MIAGGSGLLPMFGRTASGPARKIPEISPLTSELSGAIGAGGMDGIHAGGGLELGGTGREFALFAGFGADTSERNVNSDTSYGSSGAAVPKRGIGGMAGLLGSGLEGATGLDAPAAGWVSVWGICASQLGSTWESPVGSSAGQS